MKYVLLLCLFSITAYAQVNGSIVVYELTADGFFIAADSRSSASRGLPEDDRCKISAISNNFVFAATGGTAYASTIRDFVGSWDSHDEARRALEFFRKNLSSDMTDATTAERLQAIADLWAARLASDWAILAIIHPDKVKPLAKNESGILVKGIFALAENGAIYVTGRAIVQDADEFIHPQDVSLATCAIGSMCAQGTVAIFIEFTHHTSTRAKAEKIPDSPMSRVRRLVELTIAYDDTGMVGGPICSLELTKDGKIIWFDQ